MPCLHHTDTSYHAATPLDLEPCYRSLGLRLLYQHGLLTLSCLLLLFYVRMCCLITGRDITILCIAHRLSSIIYYDKVLVLEQGNLAEYDSPLVLLDDKKSLFHSLCEKSGDLAALRAIAVQEMELKQSNNNTGSNSAQD